MFLYPTPAKSSGWKPCIPRSTRLQRFFIWACRAGRFRARGFSFRLKIRNGGDKNGSFSDWMWMRITRWSTPRPFTQPNNGRRRNSPSSATGSSASAAFEWSTRAGRALRRLERASLGEFAAALAGAQVFIGNDSGPAHMAAALARPSVIIFGSSSSKIWGPWPRPSSESLARVVQNYYECNPCPGDRCYRYERPECILSVTLEQVQLAVESALAARPRVEDAASGTAPGDSR